jgi:hypothetical protein
MSGGEDRALTSQLSAQVLAAMAEVADSDRPAVHALASSIRETIVKGEILMPGLGQLALSLACLQFQEQPTAAAPAGDTAPGMTASEVNGAVRKEILELLRCTGRSQLLAEASERPLVDVIAMLFTEISDVDADAQAAPKLRERVAELEQMVADTHGPMQAQIAELNRRIVALNSEIDAKTCGSDAQHTAGPWEPVSLLREPYEAKARLVVRRLVWKDGKPDSERLPGSFSTLEEARTAIAIAIATATGSASS